MARLPFDPIAEAGRLWDLHWGPDAVPAMLAVTSIMRAQQILLGRLNEILKPMDLTFPRYEALMLLHYSRRGTLPLGVMGERLQVHRASVTNLVDRLEAQGLVRRAPHARDRRAVLAEITSGGRRVAKRATAKVNEALFGIGALGDEQLGELFELLRPLRIDAGDFED
jgi:DNA-binding MarR family transcriptional regulator